MKTVHRTRTLAELVLKVGYTGAGFVDTALGLVHFRLGVLLFDNGLGVVVFGGFKLLLEGVERRERRVGLSLFLGRSGFGKSAGRGR